MSAEYVLYDPMGRRVLFFVGRVGAHLWRQAFFSSSFGEAQGDAPFGGYYCMGDLFKAPESPPDLLAWVRASGPGPCVGILINASLVDPESLPWIDLGAPTLNTRRSDWHFATLLEDGTIRPDGGQLERT